MPPVVLPEKKEGLLRRFLFSPLLLPPIADSLTLPYTLPDWFDGKPPLRTGTAHLKFFQVLTNGSDTL